MDGGAGSAQGQPVSGVPLSERTILGAKQLSPNDPAMVGRYRIHGLLGVGGMGRVYLGAAPGTAHGSAGSAAAPAPSAAPAAWVAVKVIRPDLADNPEFRRRFARELEAVGRVRTPHVAALVHGEPHAAQPWMATEFVPGVALLDAVQQGGPLPDPAVWRLAADLGSALVAVHQADLVHRDVKPSNVILGDRGAKIIDFGVAHASDLSQLTATGLSIGTPSYMAPEQAKSGEVTPASDMFSLGVLLYFAATGKLPFGEGGTAEVLFRVVYEEPDFGSLEHVSPALRDLMSRCLAKDPLSRPNAAGLVALTQSAASSGAWMPSEFAQWPPALAQRISARTRAAGQTLPDAVLRELAQHAPVIPVPSPLPPDELQTVVVGRRSDDGRRNGDGSRRRGQAVAGSAAAVVIVGVVAMLVWGTGGAGNGRVDSLSDTVGAMPGAGASPGGASGAASVGPADFTSSPASAPTTGSASGSPSTSGPAASASSSAASGAAGSSSSAAAAPPGAGTSSSAPAGSGAPSKSPTGGASPVSTGCGGWNAVERGSEYGYTSGNGSWNLYSGPYSACATTGFTVSHGDRLRFWCYVTNAYGHEWTYVQDTANGEYGWISDSNFVGGIGSTDRC